MADNNYTLLFNLSALGTVGYGTTKYSMGSALLQTVDPAYGLSAVVLQNLSVSGSNSTVKYALSADTMFPKTLTWDGTTGQSIFFNVSANNLTLHAANLATTLIVYSTAYGVLSSGSTGTVLSGVSASDVLAFTAAGDAAAPAAVTLLSATGWLSGGVQLISSLDRQIKLDWVNPVDADVAAIKVRRLDSHPVTAVTDGSEVYSGLLTTYTDLLADAQAGNNIFYGVYTVDNVAKTSDIVQLSATCNFGGVWASVVEHGRLYVEGII